MLPRAIARSAVPPLLHLFWNAHGLFLLVEQGFDKWKLLSDKNVTFW
jgi:hypothetical protein